jgi:hypothetical protein
LISTMNPKRPVKVGETVSWVLRQAHNRRNWNKHFQSFIPITDNPPHPPRYIINWIDEYTIPAVFATT